MIKLLAKKSKLIVASGAVLFATAFMPGACTVNIDQALLDQLSGLLGNVSFGGGFEGGGQWQGGPHDGFDGHDGFDDHGGFGNHNGNGNGNGNANSNGV